MRVLVCGGRDYTDFEELGFHLSVFRAKHGISAIIHGGARGADALADLWAKENGIPVEVFKADWTVGRRAGPIRNAKMLQEGKPDIVVAFKGGKGTANMVWQARMAGVNVIGPRP